MSTHATPHVTSQHPARTDLAGAPSSPSDRSRPATPAASTSRAWARTGLAGALCTAGAIVSSYAISSVYQEDLSGDAPAIVADLNDKVPFMVSFHVLETLAAVLIAVFALGLARRLRSRLDADSLLPAAAAFGLLGTSVVMVLAAGLDTEFAFAATDTDLVVPEALVFYNHWIGTIPGCWVLAGLTGLALYGASRSAAVSRLVGRTGLVLGGLTLVLGISPLQYMAGLTGTLMLIVVAAAFSFGDRAQRA